MISPDFPGATMSAISGAQPKMAAVENAGRYVAGTESVEQLQAQYEMCEDLAHQMRDYCARKLSEGAASDQQAALARGLAGLRAKRWCTEERSVWVINRAATLLAWPLLDVAPPRSIDIPDLGPLRDVTVRELDPTKRVLTDIERILLQVKPPLVSHGA